MMGTPKGSTKSGFMEKPGIEPATPGLQGIALIHYTTVASLRMIAPLAYRVSIFNAHFKLYIFMYLQIF